MADSTANSHPEVPRKKSYGKPSLQIYGNIVKITQTSIHTSATGDNSNKTNGKSGAG